MYGVKPMCFELLLISYTEYRKWNKYTLYVSCREDDLLMVRITHVNISLMAANFWLGIVTFLIEFLFLARIVWLASKWIVQAVLCACFKSHIEITRGHWPYLTKCRLFDKIKNDVYKVYISLSSVKSHTPYIRKSALTSHQQEKWGFCSINERWEMYMCRFFVSILFHTCRIITVLNIIRERLFSCTLTRWILPLKLDLPMQAHVENSTGQVFLYGGHVHDGRTKHRKTQLIWKLWIWIKVDGVFGGHLGSFCAVRSGKIGFCIMKTSKMVLDA